MKRHQLIIVEWLDHTEPGLPNWTSSTYQTSHLASCFSVGWVVRQDADTMVLVPHISYTEEDTEWSTPLLIVKNAILNIWEIKDLPPPSEES